MWMLYCEKHPVTAAFTLVQEYIPYFRGQSNGDTLNKYVLLLGTLRKAGYLGNT